MHESLADKPPKERDATTSEEKIRPLPASLSPLTLTETRESAIEA